MNAPTTGPALGAIPFDTPDPAAMQADLAKAMEQLGDSQSLLAKALSLHAARISEEHGARMRAVLEKSAALTAALSEEAKSGALLEAAQEYWRDAVQRAALTMDALRARGDTFHTHEAAGCPPVLVYDYEVIMDGADLPRPCNYVLLRIKPKTEIDAPVSKRPYVIIDPRAGHGAGIGGFKTDSQVGVALADGHPVYFVSFRREPVPGQTLADVTRAEAEFVREVSRRHPDAARPVVVGNCQGGWATLLLAAANPDIAGPIVLNGAPVAPWSGEIGTNVMRYNGGVLGGEWQPMFWSDLGGGVFDGAHLVMNFEMLNPGRTWFRKYYDLFSGVDTQRQRFLEFERWWSGFFLLNEAEIRWIVGNLFVGNRIAKNEARLEPGRHIDVKAIRAPVIVFASHGDNITPPQQALNWIADSYADAQEIKIRGQRIIYMVHEEVGHLGIFVSSKIAKKEHSQVSSTLKTIEALAPGLYEMKIDEAVGSGHERSYTVSFFERSLEDVAAIDDGRQEEAAFAAVARASELQAELYDIWVRPAVKAAVTPAMAEIGRRLHPLRMQRAAMSSSNPVFDAWTDWTLGMVGARQQAASDNPFLALEKLGADMIEQSFDLARDLRDMSYEALFLSAWNTPLARAFGAPNALGRTLKRPEELATLPEVRAALLHAGDGGFVEAVIRMLVLLADSRGTVRRDRLERSARVLTQDAPFRDLHAEERARIIHEQSLIVTFDRDKALETLTDLLPDAKTRELALTTVRYVPGPIDEMTPHTLETLQDLARRLDLPPVSDDVTDDPLADQNEALKA